MSLRLKDLLYQINSCDKCEACLDVCPTFTVTANKKFTPMDRLETALSIYNLANIDDTQIESIYNCPECNRCWEVCPQDIDTAQVVAACRVELVNQKITPLDAHKPILKSIREKGNSVNGKPSERLDWLPAECEGHLDKSATTLFYAGCLPSYLVKKAARSSCLLLKKAGVDFTIMSDEGCCGVYLYDAGLRVEAKATFLEKVKQFQRLGVERIVTPCAGCYRCFKRYYPDTLESFDFEILHITEFLSGLIKEGRLSFKKGQRTSLVYHDPCRLGRKEGLFDPPRNLLKHSGVDLLEFPDRREQGMCCGAGAGIRSLYRGLSLKIGRTLLDATPQEQLVSSCPFCVFNLGYTARKTKAPQRIKYITEVLYDRLLL